MLGLFIGTVAYSLVILVSLDDPSSGASVPQYAVTTAAALTFICLLALLLYVHKIARAIIADVVIEHVAADLQRGLHESLVPAGSTKLHEPARDPPPAGTINIGKAGYVQLIDYDDLVATARRAGVVLHVHVRAGDYLLRAGTHVSVRARSPLSQDQVEVVIRAFQIGGERSSAQDLEYAIRQLVETGTKALQPGSKELFTVTAVLDKLGKAIEMLICDRELPGPVIEDDDGDVRLLVSRPDAAGLIAAAFEQIRQSGGDDPAVLEHIADLIGKLLDTSPRPDGAEALLRELDRLAETAADKITVASDREACQRRISAAREKGASRRAR